MLAAVSGDKPSQNSQNSASTAPRLLQSVSESSHEISRNIQSATSLREVLKKNQPATIATTSANTANCLPTPSRNVSSSSGKFSTPPFKC
uniref:Uncharacterized protein n=1 Tax=Tetranychus urticae TaxID=32264 RepID=T1K382_TETUR